ncbi:MAG TPA: hypothetical protein VGF67_23705 [Ktedonobacteraceae bacterium]
MYRSEWEWPDSSASTAVYGDDWLDRGGNVLRVQAPVALQTFRHPLPSAFAGAGKRQRAYAIRL